MGVTINDWMSEIKERNGKFQWITYLIALWQSNPIGLCLYYKCEDSDEDFGTLPLTGSYGIDYFIGDETYLGKGLGKNMISLLVDRIFSIHNSKIVTADIDKNNRVSEKALLSCGFKLLNAGCSRYVLYNKKN